MKIFKVKIISFRDLLATAGPIILLTAIGFAIAYQFVKPAPPGEITITSGSESGAYYLYAKQYQTLLAANGITLKLRTSDGSVENLERLNKEEADIAFVQGGVTPALAEGEESQLMSLGSVAYEPVWVFYRSDVRLDKLFHLAGKRIAVGEEGSGVRGLALKLLEANGMFPKNTQMLPVSGPAAVEAMRRGEIDAAFIVAAPEAQAVRKMLFLPGVRLMSFSQADAYVRRFPFLSRIVLPHGVADLLRDIPPRDTVLLATTANVVIRNDLHPALISLLLQAMTEVHGKNGFFQRNGEFPAYKDRSFELAPDAERYFKSGPSFLQRYLPFWVAVLVERLFVLVVPVIILLFPLLKAAPSIYSWRVRSKIFRCYGDLKFLENELRQNYDPASYAEYLKRLDSIEEEAHLRNIPLAFSDLLYTLREHINLVRDKLQRLESGKPQEHKP